MNKALKKRLNKKFKEFRDEAAQEGEFEELVPDKLFKNMIAAAILVYDQNIDTNKWLRREGYIS
ncbi:MAG: hypothetical protein WC346_22560 [Methanogenium sp.]|jgi:hypothetical protein